MIVVVIIVWVLASGGLKKKIGDPPKPLLGKLRVTGIGASSIMPDWNDQKAGLHYSFSPEQMIDGDLGTCWQARSKDTGGRGQWITVSLEGDHLVSRIDIANGFQRQDRWGDLFEMNNRIRNARAVFPDGTSEALSFGQGERGLKRFSLATHRCSHLRIWVDDVWIGSKWPDLSVSEIAVYGE
jgi:hypothetical protein